LAIAQATIVKQQLEDTLPGLECELVPIKSTGDRLTTASLADVGGKGLFIKELEEALLSKRIDIAVHSMKDLPSRLDRQFRIMAVPPRENARDVLIAANVKGLEQLPRGATVGTSSPRRHFQLLHVRPDLSVVPLRGNVDTRLGRLARGELDGIILAFAGLSRLGRAGIANLAELSEKDFVPAGGQGALAIEALADAIVSSEEVERSILSLNDAAACAETTAERAFLAAVGASCTSPIGVKASSTDSALIIRAQVFSIDGGYVMDDEVSLELGAERDPSAAGIELATRMLKNGADKLIGSG